MADEEKFKDYEPPEKEMNEGTPIRDIVEEEKKDIQEGNATPDLTSGPSNNQSKGPSPDPTSGPTPDPTSGPSPDPTSTI